MSLSSQERLHPLSGRTLEGYVPHLLHGSERTYRETNCYADVLIELLHACGREPLAMFGHLLRLDFEGDQWTFFKPPPEDLEALFGVDIHEMQPYRPLPVQIEGQLELGRTIIVELDSFYLPDTVATSYRAEHVKTSVAAELIDPARERLRYFHGLGMWELRDEDYRKIFRLEDYDEWVPPPYTELVRFDAGPRLEAEDLRARALELLRGHIDRRPADNPFVRFGEALERELPGLLQRGIEDYHAYAFATVRMAGSAFEIAGEYTRWQLGTGGERAAGYFDEIVEGCKVLSFKLARRRSFDPTAILANLAQAWQRAQEAVEQAAR